LVGLTVLISGWEIVSLLVEPIKVPSPLVTFERLLANLMYSAYLETLGGGIRGYLPHVVHTSTSVLTAAPLGMVTGVLLGLAVSRAIKLSYLLAPSIEIARVIPPLAILPFFIMWFGYGPYSQFVALVFYSALILVINTIEAVRNVHPVYKQFAYSLGASHNRVFKDIIVRAIIPELRGGIRVAFALAWGIQVVIELMGAPVGMGMVFSILIRLSAYPLIIGGIILITIAAVLVDQVVLIIMNYLTRWQPRG